MKWPVAMAGLREVNSFVGKFVHLWQSGFNANLNIKSCAGNASINLEIELGQAPFLPPTNHVSPSRLRRRHRREEARKVAVQAGDSSIVTENVAEAIIEEVIEADEANGVIEREAEEATVGTTSGSESNAEEALGFNAEEANAATEPKEDNLANDDKTKDKDVAYEDLNKELGTMETNETEATTKIPEIVMIHATAIFDDSPNETLTRDEIESLGRFIHCKEHLERNIESFQYSNLSTRAFRNSKFKHTVQVMIKVKTANLWEGSRNYVWKHLGSDTWTRANGTKISLVRIHQK